MKLSSKRKIEFIAKTVTDLGKAVFVVALASGFFEKLPLFWRIGITFLSILFVGVGIVLFPAEGEEK